MQIRIRFSYFPSVVPPRCRRPRLALVDGGDVVISVREVADADAPIALRVHAPDRDGVAPIDYRWDGDRFFACMPVVDCRCAKGAVAQERPAVEVDVRGDSLRLEDMLPGLRLTRFMGPEEIVAAAHQWARDSLVVVGDGHLWRAVGEPRYVVRTLGMGGGHGGVLVSLTDSFDPLVPSDRFFRADELDAAVDCATRITEERRDAAGLPIRPLGEIEVLRGDALRLPRRCELALS